MAKYIVDRMVVGNPKFKNKALQLHKSGEHEVVLVEEILHESRTDRNYEAIKGYSTDKITREHVSILKMQVVNGMIDCGALLPDEGSGETMVAVEYLCKGAGEQVGLFESIEQGRGRVIVTADKKAKDFFQKNNMEFICEKEFFELMGGIE
jgi:hypothetical protein